MYLRNLTTPRLLLHSLWFFDRSFPKALYFLPSQIVEVKNFNGVQGDLQMKNKENYNELNWLQEYICNHLFTNPLHSSYSYPISAIRLYYFAVSLVDWCYVVVIKSYYYRAIQRLSSFYTIGLVSLSWLPRKSATISWHLMSIISQLNQTKSLKLSWIPFWGLRFY